MAQPCHKCHITGRQADATEMLRFVAAPDGRLTLDLAGKLPDGGAPVYVLARRAVVEALHVGLADRVAGLMRRQVLAQLGLARKAGQLVLGFTKTEAALAKGQVALLLAAHDGAVHGRKALAAKAKAGGVPLSTVFSADELGMALGRDNVIHAGLTDAAWAARIADETLRLVAYDQTVTDGSCSEENDL